MSSSIVIALPKIEDAKKIRTILNRHGLTVASVCSSVSNALASISELDSGVLICGYKLTDAPNGSATGHKTYPGGQSPQTRTCITVHEYRIGNSL